MSDIREFDVIVLGAGPAGEVCAGRLAQNGRAVALVEQELVGGECSFYACMPSKGLLRPAQALAEVRRVSGAAEAATGTLDVAAVLARRDEIIHNRDDSAQMPWLEERGIALVRGHGTLAGEREVRVGERLLRARKAVILAPGTRAAIPSIPGLAEAEPWTNREVTTSEAIPGSLIVLGGGVVGVEMAQAYASLGARVTVVEAMGRLIASEEEFASDQVREGLEGLGVEVVLGVKATSVTRAGGAGPVSIELEDGRSFSGDEILAAVGRQPNTDSLGVESLGIEPGKSIAVDDTMRVPGHEWLYVVGDANGRVLLTHMGKYQARLAADHILGRPVSLRSDGKLSPRVIFTEPQVAAVGHTLTSAREAGLYVRAADVPVGAVAGASFIGHGAPGTARVIVDEERGVLVGATFTGVDVAEWLHAATIAVVCEVPLELLAHAVPSFPTRSEVWLRLLEELGL
ncbi:MAG TPA: NAD(P)/FAD-dependent oxidoreductase [Solirubrobacteraceae bacterium]|nr:NAD(P)/FAD-dependent oxidoreductase [Solirubrobacteraceae bacterium]